MIGKVLKNSSFERTLRYVSSKPGARMIGGNMAGRDFSELLREFWVARRLRRDVNRPVYHISLSLPHQDSLDDDSFSVLADRYLAAMILLSKRELLGDLDFVQHGLQADSAPFQAFKDKLQGFLEEELPCYPYVVFRHSDRTHQHIHIVSSRINLLSGEVVSDSFDYYRSQKVIRFLELEFGLTQLSSSWDVGRRSQTISQLERLSAGTPVMTRLQRLLDEVFEQSSTLSESIDKLLESGVSVSLNRLKGGKWGISYGLNGVVFPGYRLGNKYSLNGVKKRGLFVDEPRDYALIKRRLDQARKLRKLFPGLLSVWRYLESARISFVDGKNYRFSVWRVKDSQGNDRRIFAVYRKLYAKDSVPGVRGRDSVKVLSLECSTSYGGVKDVKHPIEFDLASLRIEDRDFERLSQGCEQFSRFSNVMMSLQKRTDQDTQKSIREKNIKDLLLQL